jgi:hypothetical protein
MKHIILNEAFKMRDLALEGIQEVDQQLELCSKELDQPISYNESEEIIAQMMELKFHKNVCKESLKTINSFIKENKYLFN